MLAASMMACALAVMMARPAGTAQSDTERVEHWIGTLWDREPGFELDGSLVIWTIEAPERLAPDDLEALRRDVAGKPDHPGRQRIAAAERTAAGRPDGTRYRLWTARENAYRLNADLWGQAEIYLDRVRAPGKSWDLTTNQLRVFDPRIGPPSLYGGEREHRAALADLERLVTAGLAEVRANGFARPVVAPILEARTWTAVSTNAAGARLDITGGWSDPERKPLITSVTLREAARRQAGQTLRFDRWAPAPPLSDWMAWRMEHDPAPGVPERRVTFERVVPAPEDELARLFETPSAGQADPVRGQPTFVDLVDFRSGTEGITRFAGGAPVATEPLPPGLAGDVRSRLTLRHVGWALAAMITTALLAIWLRRTIGNA